ncbi:MAG: Fic family protein [Ruminococcus sp.]|nr:Fic family protein [Ruminococcus sp.]
MSGYTPPFDITNKMIALVSEISELIGQLKTTAALDKNPTLRRRNRILTIHSSLSIEQNTLTVEQVTAVLGGKQVLAPPKDIEEVKNAYEIYENLDMLDPFSCEDLLKAHGVMMRGLVQECGEFRSKPVGVADSNTGEIIHFGTLPAYVPELTEKLLNWVRDSEVHMLIKGCVFHYEFEVIHPFFDGNGRMGRLWHTLLLSKWNRLFAWLPVESMIYKRQQGYYDAINLCNNAGSSTVFIEFMLETIKLALNEALATISSEQADAIDRQESRQETAKKPPRTKADIEEQILEQLQISSRVTRKQLALMLNVSEQTVRYRLEKLQREGRIAHKGSTKAGEWVVI